MKIRHGLMALIAFWTAGECWSFPWDPVFWPRAFRGIHWGVFIGCAALAWHERLRPMVIDLVIITMAARLLSVEAWHLWMMEAWFKFDWLYLLSRATDSDGERAYRMVEYMFFLISSATLSLFWFTLGRRWRSGR